MLFLLLLLKYYIVFVMHFFFDKKEPANPCRKSSYNKKGAEDIPQHLQRPYPNFAFLL